MAWYLAVVGDRAARTGCLEYSREPFEICYFFWRGPLIDGQAEPTAEARIDALKSTYRAQARNFERSFRPEPINYSSAVI